MPKTWAVDLPITGYLSVEVEAEDAEEAIEKALELECGIDKVVTWEATEHVARGNVSYAVLNDAQAYPVDEDKDDAE